MTEGAGLSLAPLSLPRFSMSLWILQLLPRLRDGDLVSEGKAVTPSVPKPALRCEHTLNIDTVSALPEAQ